jgi:putative addiction module antidote
MRKTTIRKIGKSVGVILPKETLDRLGLREGDELAVIEGRDAIELAAYDPEFDRAIKAYECTRSKYRDSLRKLADA